MLAQQMPAPAANMPPYPLEDTLPAPPQHTSRRRGSSNHSAGYVPYNDVYPAAPVQQTRSRGSSGASARHRSPAPPPPGTRSRGSSNASNKSAKYIPESYAGPPPVPALQDGGGRLVPPPRHGPSPLVPDTTQPYVPVDAEQYRAPRYPPGIPPAQMYPVRSHSDNPHNHRRTGDIPRPRSHSRHSQRSEDPHRRSYASDRSRYSDDLGRSRSDRSSGDSSRPRHDSHHHHHHDRRSEDLGREKNKHHKHHHHHDDEDDYKLKRRDTPRGYGSSLWGVFDNIKNAFKD